MIMEKAMLDLANKNYKMKEQKMAVEEKPQKQIKYLINVLPNTKKKKYYQKEQNEYHLKKEHKLYGKKN